MQTESVNIIEDLPSNKEVKKQVADKYIQTEEVEVN